MRPANPDYADRVRQIFDLAPFVQHLGIQLDDVQPGLCSTHLDVRPEHLQQDGFIHAGVQGTLADHTAGAAAGTLMPADQIVLTVEFKLHLLRPAKGQRLDCTAKVLKPGRTLSIVESEVKDSDGKLVSKLVATMALR